MTNGVKRKMVKLNSSNTFTANQIINGDLNAINTTFAGLTTCTDFTSPNGFIYTLEADTATSIGCITDSFSTLEAEIERLVITKRSSVDYYNNIQPILTNDLTTKSYVDNLFSSSAKLNSANTFTELQTINGNLKADYVLVENTTPTLSSHVTSKLYVDTAVNKKQDKLDATSALSVDRVSTLGDITSGGNLIYYDICLGLEMLNKFFLQLIQQLTLNKI